MTDTFDRYDVTIGGITWNVKEGCFLKILAKANKDALLAKLASFEKMAKDLGRARSLRRLMREIAVRKAAPVEVVDSLALMALMADWLDPLVKAQWPNVDGVEYRNPYGSLW
jgi:hypothetical protein